MLKIFSTQLIGHFNRIQQKEELSIEDGARLLAQASVGEGDIYVYATEQLKPLVDMSISEEEGLPSAKKFPTDLTNIQPEDRVLLFSPLSTNKNAIKIAEFLRERQVPTVAVTAIEKESTNILINLVDVHIDSKLNKQLVPTEDGTRIGFPTLMTSLYVYYGLLFSIREMISEYDHD
ncbi:DUF2529 family protein [Bacillus carboniphilus]|uniref:DUF2529 family protein n=1 Tax=Bacillus carboniphilus TaxID=86663 RepID=A0ABY9JQM5_9BACI|nr:DUF2529 family protein [Bacillus carboniphilus]WLR41696.1 DUF2529 family protein [Bacillus carboniphilus]